MATPPQRPDPNQIIPTFHFIPSEDNDTSGILRMVINGVRREFDVEVENAGEASISQIAKIAGEILLRKFLIKPNFLQAEITKEQITATFSEGGRAETTIYHHIFTSVTEENTIPLVQRIVDLAKQTLGPSHTSRSRSERDEKRASEGSDASSRSMSHTHRRLGQDPVDSESSEPEEKEAAEEVDGEAVVDGLETSEEEAERETATLLRGINFGSPSKPRQPSQGRPSAASAESADVPKHDLKITVTPKPTGKTQTAASASQTPTEDEKPTKKGVFDKFTNSLLSYAYPGEEDPDVRREEEQIEAKEEKERLRKEQELKKAQANSTTLTGISAPGKDQLPLWRLPFNPFGPKKTATPTASPAAPSVQATPAAESDAIRRDVAGFRAPSKPAADPNPPSAKPAAATPSPAQAKKRWPGGIVNPGNWRSMWRGQ